MSDFKPEDIGSVPTTVPDTDFDLTQSSFYSSLAAELQNKLSEAEGKIKHLKGQNILAQTRADLMKGSEKRCLGL